MTGLLLLCGVSGAVAQQPKPAGEAQLREAAEPTAQARTNRRTAYKRLHQEALARILNGNDGQAIGLLNDFLIERPDDDETYYMLAVAHARAGRTEDAIDAAKKAIALGLPPERFVVGSLTQLKALDGSPFLSALQTKFAHAPLHGPMIGNVTDHSVDIWVRTRRGATVHAVVATDADFSHPFVSQEEVVTLETDFSAVLRLSGLRPATTYNYRIVVDGEATQRPSFRFRTSSVAHQPTKLRFAFGGGAGYVPQHERMWTTIDAAHPDLLLLLGDNIYSDSPESPPMQHFCYYRRQSRPEFRQLVDHTPVYSIWDDHDFGTNDCVEGPLVNQPAWKLPVFRVFRNNWVNPGYGRSDDQPGCYYDFYVGDVHFIMLDGRFYRTLDPSRGGPTMLGPVQGQWLLNTIEHGQGRLTIICSPVPWTFQAKGESRDTWNGFRSERNEILDHLIKCQKGGVFLVSADRHRSDLWKIERQNGTSTATFYEFNSSRLTNQHVHKTMPEAEFSYNAKPSFGVVDVNTVSREPYVTYRIVSIDGEEVFQRKFVAD